MSNETAVVKTEEKLMEYIPFGAKDKIKLSVSIIKNMIAVKTKSGKTCSDQDAMKFMMMCHARGLNPWESDAFLIGYDGRDGATFSLITAHQAFLKRAELHPEYDGMKSGIIVERDGKVEDLEGDFYMTRDKLLGGWATVYFKNRKVHMHKRVRLERFKKPFGIWMDDSAGMICKCAEADALRSSFPTMLGGLYLQEEIQREVDAPSRPLFSTPSTAVETTVVVEPEKQPESPAEAAMRTPVDEVIAESKKTEPIRILRKATEKKEDKTPSIRIKELLFDSKLKEEQLIAFLKDIGAVEGADIKTIDNLVDAEPSVAAMVIEQWEDISVKMKG